MLCRRAYCLKPTVLLLHHLVSPRSTAHSATWRQPLPRRRCAIGASPTTSNEPSANRRTRSPHFGSPCRSENSCAGGVMDCVLLWVRPQTTVPDWRPTARATAAATKRRMYAFFEGQTGSPRGCTIQTVGILADLYEAIAKVAPQLDVVPLLPACGWTLERVASIRELQSAAVPDSSTGDELRELNRFREGAGLHAVELRSTLAEGKESAEEAWNDSASAAVGLTDEQGGDSSSELTFAHVAVGGTFDHLHAGHRLLLATAAAIASDTVWLGIASDSLLAKKKNAHLLEGYGSRERNASEFIQRVRPGIAVSAGALTDPSEPPLAATMEGMGALVVSRETTSGADWINSHRKSAGFRPIAVVVVGLIGADGQTAESTKLSSSALREARASREEPQE